MKRMRKQLRAADLYQAYANVPHLPQIRGINAYDMRENDCDEALCPTVWVCCALFKDRTMLSKRITCAAEVRVL